VVLIFSFSTVLPAQQVSPLLTEARQKIYLAFGDKKESKALYTKLTKVKEPDPILKGYIGGVNIAQSKHAPLPEKSEYLKTGTALLDNAIKENPNSLELIFLRLTIQINLPSFLGYHDNLEEDKKFVLAHHASAAPALKENITNFIRKSDYFSAEEKAMVN
jgi:hypothetical protein